MGGYLMDHGMTPLIDTDYADHEKLLDLRSNVHPLGDGISFSVLYTHHKPIKVHISFPEMGAILNELRYASNLMVSRQRGTQRYMELMDHALKPQHIEVIIDPKTGDRILILMFKDHAPLSIRLSAEDEQTMCENLIEAKTKAAN